MGYLEVFEKLVCNCIVFLSPGDLLELEQHFDTAAIRTMQLLRENRSHSETVAREELFILV